MTWACCHHLEPDFHLSKRDLTSVDLDGIGVERASCSAPLIKKS